MHDFIFIIKLLVALDKLCTLAFNAFASLYFWNEYGTPSEYLTASIPHIDLWIKKHTELAYDQRVFTDLIVKVHYVLNLFRFLKNMSSTTKINRTVFFGAILITRFVHVQAFLPISGKQPIITFPNFYQNTNLMENQNMAYLIVNLMRISKNHRYTWKEPSGEFFDFLFSHLFQFLFHHMICLLNCYVNIYGLHRFSIGNSFKLAISHLFQRFHTFFQTFFNFLFII